MIAFPSNKSCPRCKGEMQYLVITTYPPRYKARCLYCGYEDGDTIQKQTNADRIRAMSDEELAEFMSKSSGCGPEWDKEYCNSKQRCGENCWLDWMREEVDDA